MSDKPFTGITVGGQGNQVTLTLGQLAQILSQCPAELIPTLRAALDAAESAQYPTPEIGEVTRIDLLDPEDAINAAQAAGAEVSEVGVSER